MERQLIYFSKTQDFPELEWERDCTCFISGYGERVDPTGTYTCIRSVAFYDRLLMI